jgi:hypothetical protein
MPTGDPPKQLNSIEMELLLKASGYLWDKWTFGFRRTRDLDHETIEQYLAKVPNIISVEELEDHGCFNLDASLQERHASEGWLRERIKAAE